jgi:ferrous iron transport protein A
MVSAQNSATTLAGCPLLDLRARECGLILGLDGSHGLVSRLASLGFVPGTPILMVHNYGSGPIIVRVRQARVALGRPEAMHILVQKETAA